MKIEYLEKAEMWIDAIDTKNRILQQMLKGEIPPNQVRAIELTQEIEKLLEQVKNIIAL